MWNALLLATLLALPQDARPDAPAPHRQFDFWVGEWSVLNRHINERGAWREGNTTRARITPVCGGKAVLEEWAGPFRGGFQNGFSLRAFDPAREDWELLLFWTMDGNGGFGRLRGEFRHGRGDFFSNTSGPNRTRYSFSDALPNTVRWDSSTTSDSGVTWKTDWIMEFSRTRAAAEVTQDNLFATEWTTGKVSPHDEARQLDWMLGNWNGTQVGGDGKEREARLRCKLLNKDCLTLDLLETRTAGAKDWDERLVVRGFEVQPRSWGAWRLSEEDTVLASSRGALKDKTMIFARELADGTVEEEYLIPVDADHMTIEEIRITPDGDESTVTTRLTRDPR